jgi:chromosomal replication initiator protein
VGLSSSNIRELEGAAMRLFVYMTLERPHSPKKYQSLTAEEAELIVEKSFIRTEKRVDVRAIQQNVEEYYGISHSDLIGAQRSQNISNARHIAMYLARTLTNISLPEIGKAFGGKDHTSVLYACRNTEKKYAGDPEKRYEINFLKEQIMS